MKKTVAPQNKKVTLEKFYGEFRLFRKESMQRMDNFEKRANILELHFTKMKKDTSHHQKEIDKKFDYITTMLDKIVYNINKLDTERYAMIQRVERLEKKVFGE